MRPGATHDGGVWRLPKGEDYYRFGLKYFTTSSMTPDEVHQMGLEQVAEISARTDALLKAGYSESDVQKIWSGNVLRVLAAAEAGKQK